MKNGDQIYLKPADGVNVRNPDDGNRHLPEAGAWVTLNTFLRRRLKDGDAIAAPAPRPAKPEPKKGD